MSQKELYFTGRVIHRQTGCGLAGLRVEAWDHDRAQDAFGHVVTDKQGRFAIDVAPDAFSKREAGDDPLDFKPDVHVKALCNANLIPSAKPKAR